MITKNKWIKLLLSLIIFFHILCVLILPNPSSILSRYFPDFLVSYANTLGVNYTWQFFAPNPGLERTIAYEVTYDEEFSEDNKEFRTYYWPPKDRKNYFLENYNRRVYHSILTSINLDKSKSLLTPFLCSLHKGSKEISLRVVSFFIPSMEKVRKNREKREDYITPTNSPAQTYECKRET